MITCPSCGHGNPEDARFCTQCAALLSNPGRAEGEERKVVTSLFCDLAGFTLASESVDPEDVDRMLAAYFKMARTHIENHGGLVEKFIGDAIVGVFGVPAAHEDDPERAVRAGLRIIEDAEDMRGLGGSPLRLRVGINTGEVLVRLGVVPGSGEGFLRGDAVNTAARLQSVAPEMSVVVGETTWEATKAIFEYEELEQANVKGKAEPLRVFLARNPRARFGSDLTRKHATPFVGREIDLALLKGIFDKTIASASVQLITVVGEPGIGKSRIIGELSNYVDALPEFVIWRQGRCLPYGEGITFWALGEIVKAHAGVLESDDTATAAVKLEAVVPPGQDRQWMHQRLLPLLGIGASSIAEREELFAAWRQFIELIAETHPTVLVFEDLHWADDPMLEFLDDVLDKSESVPLLIVCTARPELFERHREFAAGFPNSNRVNLDPLSDAETARLTEELLGSGPVPAKLQDLIVERSGGNPLFAEEFVRLLRDKHLVVLTGSGWRLAPDAEIPFSSSIQALIAARLDTLSPDHKAVLTDAAVVGKIFWAGAVASIGERDLREVVDALRVLSRQEFVRSSRRSTIEGEAEYSFWHMLARDVAYAQLPRGARAAKHVAAATWLESKATGRIEGLAEVLASHYEAALDLEKAAGSSDVSGLTSGAIRYHTLAGDRTLELDVRSAERNFSRALELSPAEDPERPRILARHAEALQRRGRFAEAAEAFAEAVAGLRAQGDDDAAATVLNDSRAVLLVMGDSRAREVVTEAVAILEPRGASQELISALAEEAMVLQLDGNHRASIEAADRAIEMSVALGVDEPARALGVRGAARCRLGDERGLRDFERALELAKSQGLGAEVARLHNNLGVALSWMEGPRRALETFRSGLALASKRGNEEWVLAFRTGIVSQLLELGLWDEAVSEADALEPMVEAAEDIFDLAALRLARGRIFFYRGEWGAAAWPVEWAVERAREFGQPQMIADCYPIGAANRQATGDTAGALDLLVELERWPNVRDSEEYRVRLPEAVRAALAAGDASIGGHLVDGVKPAHPIHQHALSTARMLLADQRGDYSLAADGFAEAARGWESFEIPYERGQALLGEGHSLLAIDRRTEAEEGLRSALEIFASLGADPAVDETSELLAQTVAIGP